MTDFQERRATSPGRVNVEALVEVCGNEPGSPAFEARATDVSPRGMHLRTAYLPELGMPLVCRFDEAGREIVVEGRVAWLRPSARGGEFGVEFTALDAGSVGALRGLCEQAHESHGHEESRDGVAAGARVRLHIDGLGSPMKARVREGGASRVQVGSNLEFLKVGRHLEVEDLDQGGRRSAQIDSVSVTVDPKSRVPQLVVQLRFDNASETTPEPTMTDLGQKGEQVAGFTISGSSVTTDTAPAAAQSPAAANPPAASASDGELDADALRGRVSSAMSQAGEAAKTASAALANFSSSAAGRLGALFKGAGGKVLDFSKRSSPSAPKRTTAPPPGGPVTMPGRRVRVHAQTQAQTDEPDASAALARRRKIALTAGGVTLIALAGTALALRRSPTPPAPAAAAQVTVVANAAAPALAPPGAPASSASLAASADPAAPNIPGAVAANVPLFGPTPMATMEPAALAPVAAPNGANVEAEERAAAQGSDGAGDKGVADESFADESDSDSADKHEAGDGEHAAKSHKREAAHDRAGAKRFGHGKLHSPTIFRLRLDAPGSSLVGTQEATGFSVRIPGRKVMEHGAGIAKRDSRIVRVRTANGGSGAEVSFKFRDAVPAYRARLRGDFVEFLISEAGDRSAKPAAKRDRARGAKPAHADKAARKRG